MKKLLLILSLVLATFSFSCASPQLAKTQKELFPKKLPVVILYSAEWCWWCVKAEEYLTENGIEYVKRDTEDAKQFKELQRIAKKLNYKRSLYVVPLFVIDTEIIPGFNPEAVEEALMRAKWKIANQRI